MTGRVLRLERLSVHDGPGIRTTVYLKGCPLRCAWCHNPEGRSPQPEVGWLQRRCRHCGRCAEVCPNGAHEFRAGVHRFNHQLCAACGRCVEACLVDALELYGTELSAPRAAAAVLEDRTFYDQSGGGCTLSGGEPLLQADFCAELCGLLGAEGVHCAVDTCGAVGWESFETVLPHTDLFLYDVKHVDERKHREGTGSSNRGILENLERLSGRGVPIEVRLPVIPGFNDDEQSLSAIGRWLSGLPNLVGVRPLPYHLARQKYQTVGRLDTMPDGPPPDADAMAGAAALLREQGLVVAAGRNGV